LFDFSESLPTTLLVLLSQLQWLQLLYQYRVSNPLDLPQQQRFQTFFTIACAKTVAVVVPSPAKSLVLELLLYHLSTHVFNGSFNSISFATVTPSLVTFGPPNFQ
jgi:hypothetical protein